MNPNLNETMIQDRTDMPENSIKLLSREITNDMGETVWQQQQIDY
jgi:hypothetical protein